MQQGSEHKQVFRSAARLASSQELQPVCPSRATTSSLRRNDGRASLLWSLTESVGAAWPWRRQLTSTDSFCNILGVLLQARFRDWTGLQFFGATLLGQAKSHNEKAIAKLCLNPFQPQALPRTGAVGPQAVGLSRVPDSYIQSRQSSRLAYSACPSQFHCLRLAYR